MKRETPSIAQRWSAAHVLAWVVASAAFPLIWMGGFVTTYRAGMAVPDWPSTFGYNLFLYPLESWLTVFDVFLEHSHRLLAASVGILTMAHSAALWFGDRRRWVVWLGVAAVAGVSLQGVLGGLRVIADERLLAKIHGCTAPLVFACLASLVTFTSFAWRTRLAGGAPPQGTPRGSSSRRDLALVLAVAVGIYLQIVAGAQLRHLTPHEHAFWFALWVWIHVIVAGLLFVAVFGVALRLRVDRGHAARIVRRGRLLAGLMLLQVILGAATWVTNYGLPVWFTEYVWELEYTVVAGGAWQAVLTTAHVAVASLLLVTAVSLALWHARLANVETEAPADE
ncbi:MAG: COX15/CtaA family protein [Anaerolineae bacterium]|nr:COX15/CtaA family protein [Anaerolineae bacterium]